MVETARLILRPFSMDDLDSLAEIFADPEVMRYVGKRRPATREETRTALESVMDHWNRSRFGVWATIDKSTGELAGFSGLCFLDGTDEIEVGYRLGRAYWGAGLATEAGHASLRFGFEILELDRIVAVVDPENVASQRVVAKLGLTFEKDAHYYNTPVKYYSITKPRYEPPNSTWITRPA
jgi:ribosomal-protein-alanine N-acetyltransferase